MRLVRFGLSLKADEVLSLSVAPHAARGVYLLVAKSSAQVRRALSVKPCQSEAPPSPSSEEQGSGGGLNPRPACSLRFAKRTTADDSEEEAEARCGESRFKTELEAAAAEFSELSEWLDALRASAKEDGSHFATFPRNSQGEAGGCFAERDSSFREQDSSSAVRAGEQNKARGASDIRERLGETHLRWKRGVVKEVEFDVGEDAGSEGEGGSAWWFCPPHTDPSFCVPVCEVWDGEARSEKSGKHTNAKPQPSAS